MFSLDAMTRGQHAITTASNSSLDSSSCASSLSQGTYGTLDSRGDGTQASSTSTSSGCASGGGGGASKTSKERRKPSKRRSKSSKSTRTANNTKLEIKEDQQEASARSISLYHEGLASSQQPLEEGGQRPTGGGGSALGDFETVLVRDKNDFVIRRGDQQRRLGDSSDPVQHVLVPEKVGKFRYVVASLIITGVMLSAYASNTMYIAAIEMISNDVLQSGMTQLRVKHMSADPLATSGNAGLPGTCPVEATSSQAKSHVAALIERGLLTLVNASEISARERHAMQVDAAALQTDVDERLGAGKLVDWTISQRGYIFTAHNIGNTLLAVPISRLGLVVGSKTTLFWCMLLASARMLVLPTLAGLTPFWGTFTFEVVVGGIGGMIIVMGYPIAAAWLLPDEANFFVALNILSNLCGTSATNFISTQLLAAGLDWCWCYYLPGALLLLLAVLWFILGADRPDLSRYVSRAELELLRANTIAQRNASELASQQHRRRLSNSQTTDDEHQALLSADTASVEHSPQSTLKRPAAKGATCRCSHFDRRDSCPARVMVRKPYWTTIFACPTVWALILVSFANNWTTKNATLWPTFFSNILHLSSSTIGIMLGIKGVFALIGGTLFIIFTRKLIVNRPFGISLTAYRRWNQALAVSFYAVSVSLIVLLDCDVLANFSALLFQPIVSGFNSISADQMPLDLSAEDSGLIVSVCRLMAIGDLIALPVSSFILSHAPNALAGDRHTWRLVWSVGLLARLTASLYFVLVAKSQPKAYSRLVPSGPCKTPLKSVNTTTTGDHHHTSTLVYVRD